ncbi:putative lipid II flippase FtsW [Conexibacter sp. JD483]|uniref:putative lipid II flippase FtsW n=1 Tax=unclassified Conexibacter TaxID=2627773 RepID=UPI002724BE57|nr:MULTISPECIES: putative lipid II flippase FtsW [unclassified Conexibacter]MDO8184622.1 putative lipid II flippase FtsW [Conexibacter sp. CPCC 205706]MDO8197928.1 putative lipid II flippase FtsW [Conexibacter sp. CPCC 205762]MDR9370107.1 putative lipid II flippase FtsW [Conexibacter sp. JD483]
MKRRDRVPTQPRPIEHRVLITATLCLIAIGAVMVYSASSARNLLEAGGSGTGYLIRYVGLGLIALAGMHIMARHGVELLRRLTPLLLLGSFAALVLVLIPGIGTEVNGARSWLGPGIFSPQPSELMKLALILYCAQFLAAHPRRIQTFRGMMSPVGYVAGAAAFLVIIEPDTGTTIVIVGIVASMLIVAGVPIRYLGYCAAIGLVLLLILVLLQPYQQDRLTSFIDPWAAKSGEGFQSVQGQIALGSGGLFGVGIGQSVQKVFYLPEAHTDFILAVIGEELGLVGVSVVIALFGLIVWSGLRIARSARDQYAKLLATGLTALIACQALLNIFVVLGMAPLTGVPLPFVSYGPTNLIVILAAVGLLLNLADRNRAYMRLVDTDREPRERPVADRDRRRRDGGPRRAGAGSRRRAAG